MTKRSITQRWLLNSLGGILLILIIVEVILTISLRNYYYSSARQYLTSKMNSISSMLVRTAADSATNFSSEVRSAVEDFEEKEKIELMAVDIRGRVTLTSSGFPPPAELDMTDFKNAQELSTGTSFQVSTFESGEKVMSLCVLLPKTNSEYSALKM
ncbi:MAG: sensor histidine kinase, partial [Oscillospiraceae bacterium]